MSILTKEASPLFARVNNTKKRQPVILRKEFENDWLSDDLDEDNLNELIHTEYPEEELETYPVNRELFSFSIDSIRKGITERIEYEELKSLFG